MDIVGILKGDETDQRAAQEPPRVRIPSEVPSAASHGALDAQGAGLAVESLKPGLLLQGIVRNVVAFGAFVDIGVGHDGLLHTSGYTSVLPGPPRVNDRVEVW